MVYGSFFRYGQDGNGGQYTINFYERVRTRTKKLTTVNKRRFLSVINSKTLFFYFCLRNVDLWRKSYTFYVTNISRTSIGWSLSPYVQCTGENKRTLTWIKITFIDTLTFGHTVNIISKKGRTGGVGNKDARLWIQNTPNHRSHPTLHSGRLKSTVEGWPVVVPLKPQ